MSTLDESLAEAMERVCAERDALAEALRQLQSGPDTLTLRGLEIVNAALLDKLGDDK